MSSPVLLGDIGGTHARFALAAEGRIGRTLILEVAEYTEAEAGIATALSELSPDITPNALALACAGPVEDGRVALTNSAWRLDTAALRERLGIANVHLLNDFAAVAWSLPKLAAADLRAVSNGVAVPGRPAVALGPGTGLGVAAFLPPPLGPQVVVGEGGHVTMAAADESEDAVLGVLRRETGHVSAERILSGDGLVRLYHALAEVYGTNVIDRSAAEISLAAMEDSCRDCRAALEMFCAMLGTIAGNLALTFGAGGGVFIAGGIVPQVIDLFAATPFRQRFEAKGRFRDYVTPIPTWVVRHPQPAFLGLQHYLEHCTK